MSDTLPPPPGTENDAQFARVEGAKAYLMAALELLVQHQETEAMEGGREAHHEILRLKEIAREVQDTAEDYLGEMIMLRPLDETMQRIDRVFGGG